ncbi:hypothetical protein J6590_051101 [Homalodisca vitripennis]|nr:hypothetical protein J6590_051101 [Homalodisca vitripennis]
MRAVWWARREISGRYVRVASDVTGDFTCCRLGQEKPTADPLVSFHAAIPILWNKAKTTKYRESAVQLCTQRVSRVVCCLTFRNTSVGSGGVVVFC